MFLKHNPIIRLLLPLTAGIIIQWYWQAALLTSVLILLLASIAVIFIQLLSDFLRLKYAVLLGLAITISIVAIGMIVTWLNDVRHDRVWFAKNNLSGKAIIITIKEPLITKEKSYKAEAKLNWVTDSHTKKSVSGNIIIYFKKDSLNKQLAAGSRIIFSKDLQEIQNTGNPGGFDYKRYALFNGITHQVYLTANDYVVLPDTYLPGFKKLLLNVRLYVLNAIKSNIHGKKEQGLAEAMLIGYKDDLDKSLLQSYTNTGVVHVIAVSGMHLALLYWILNLLFKPLLKRKSTKWIHAFLILLLLWGFAFLTGGAASIVRAAVMFSFITVSKQINRNASIYNILAAAAFCQLCYNPYWLWDVGFQLSYVAVLSIVIFFKPIYDLLFVKNKILNWIWRLAAVSVAAQILTTPLSMYYFHQFPIYFLLSNLVVVPVSTAVLFGTLVLVVVAPLNGVAAFIGRVMESVIWWLNTFIERMESFPFALWTGISINPIQVFLLFIIIAALGFWLFAKYKTGFWLALASLALFFSIRSYSFYNANHQQKIIVYNANRLAAIDFISGRMYQFIGDTALTQNASLSNFVLTPSRVFHRITQTDHLPRFYKWGNTLFFNSKKIMLIDYAVAKSHPFRRDTADLVILSRNPRLYISDLNNRLQAKQIVIDGSVPAWKANYWIKDCDSLKIPCHNVATDGAFVMSLH